MSVNFRLKGGVILIVDFNARVGKSNDIDDVIGLLGADTFNTNRNLLIKLFMIVTK